MLKRTRQGVIMIEACFAQQESLMKVRISHRPRMKGIEEQSGSSLLDVTEDGNNGFTSCAEIIKMSGWTIDNKPPESSNEGSSVTLSM